MHITVEGKTYDYNTIAQFVERKMNGANVHRLKVSLAIIREIMFDEQSNDTDKAILINELLVIGYLQHKES